MLFLRYMYICIQSNMSRHTAIESELQQRRCASSWKNFITEALGMTGVVEELHKLSVTHAFIKERNKQHCLCLFSQSWSSFADPRGGGVNG